MTPPKEVDVKRMRGTWKREALSAVLLFDLELLIAPPARIGTFTEKADVERGSTVGAWYSPRSMLYAWINPTCRSAIVSDIMLFFILVFGQQADEKGYAKKEREEDNEEDETHHSVIGGHTCCVDQLNAAPHANGPTNESPDEKQSTAPSPRGTTRSKTPRY